MKNKLILHIGTPKTGTSAIQKFLYDNQALLNEKGFSYPSQIQDSKFILTNGSPLKNYVNEKGIPNTEQAGWKEFWNVVRQHLQKNHVIISWEEMYLYNEKFFSAIQKEYENIQIIIYLRRQDRYLESFWNQCIKGVWFTLDFEQYKNKNMWQVEYLSRLDAISRIVGKNNIIVRVYEKEQFQGYHNVISDFMYSLGIDLDWDRCTLYDKPSNTALYGNYIKIKRQINYNLCKNDFISKKINLIFSQFRSSTLFRLSEVKHAEGLFAEDERKKFMEQYAEQNAKIAKEYLGRNDGILFYESKSIPMLTIDPSTLCSDIKNVFMFFFKDIEQKILVYGDLQCIKKQILEELEQIQKQIQKQILEELEQIQNKELVSSEFETACFQLVQDGIPKIIEIYQKVYSNIGNIKEACYRKKDERSFYFFGTGGFCNHIMHVLPEMEVEPDAFLDNNWQKAGSYIHQKPILHPSQIQDWKNCFVLIAVETPDMILSIEQQLQQYGLKKNQDYLVATELL